MQWCSIWPRRLSYKLVSGLQQTPTRLYGTTRSKSAMIKILCVAEKPSISKAVAGHLSGGQIQTVSLSNVIWLSLSRDKELTLFQHSTRNKYIKNYSFEFDFGPPWGRCEVTMTAVLGHLTSTLFGPEYKNWNHPPPLALFNAPILTSVADVCPVVLSLYDVPC